MATAKIIERPVQAYASISAELTIAELSRAIDGKFPALFAWLGERRIEPRGAPFIRYNRIDMAKTLDVEFGVPVARDIEPAGEVHAATLPAGRYAVLVHEGSYDGLRTANAALLDWAKQQRIDLDETPTPEGDRFACRLETYLTDPRREPNPAKWQTEVAIKVR
ncbi:MAG TPA: GyrI-like domain-containing protein [Polyangiales bacterium]|nr:GyrI-like domain-containing protein [Polyangiales bacterium]